MAYVTATDGTRLWVEEAGTGSAILFLHEFGGDHRSWEPLPVINGDADDLCLQTGLFLKRSIPRCGLAVLPKAEHTLNLEEPELFNRFSAEAIATVETGRCDRRDPRVVPPEILKTS